MALTAHAVINRNQVADRIVRGGAREVSRRADRLGTRMEVIIKGMIDRELGPTSGRAAKRGMVPMRSINWQHSVDSGTKLPIRVTLYSPDLQGPTAAKFGALNFGWTANYTGPPRPDHVRTGGWTGRQWLRRTGERAVREVRTFV